MVSVVLAGAIDRLGEAVSTGYTLFSWLHKRMGTRSREFAI